MSVQEFRLNQDKTFRRIALSRYFLTLIGISGIATTGISLWAQLNKVQASGDKTPEELPSLNSAVLDELSPEEMALNLDSLSLAEYAQLHYANKVRDRREFEPAVVFPGTDEVWRPYVMRAVAEYNLAHDLKPEDERAPRVDEFLMVIMIETCGWGQESESNARWPAGVMANQWFPEVRDHPDDRWVVVKNGVRYFGDWLNRGYEDGKRGRAQVLSAYAGYYGGPSGYNGEKPNTGLYTSYAAAWLDRGQEGIDALRDYFYGCRMAGQESGWAMWLSYLREQKGLNAAFPTPLP